MPGKKRIARVNIDTQGRIHGRDLVIIELHSISNLRVLRFNAKQGYFVGLLTLSHKETQYGLLETEVQYYIPKSAMMGISFDLSQLEGQLAETG